MNKDVFLVTGSLGCIGAWILRQLASEGVPVVAADLSTDQSRVRMIATEEELSGVSFHQADIADFGTLRALVEEYSVTHVVHLAGLQVPFCKADPAGGAKVNVLGTINVLELVRSSREQIRGFSYASSIAVMGHPESYPSGPVPDNVVLDPGTLYGVYKQAGESSARVYWNDWSIGSVGLRPFIVFGVGRDQGLTSDIAKAILAAVADTPFEINFSGPVALQYAEDVARMFIGAARAGYQGAAACNLRNDVVSVGEFVRILSKEVPGSRISYRADQPLPFPADLDDTVLRGILGGIPHTPLREAVRRTATRFKDLLDREQIDLRQLKQGS